MNRKLVDYLLDGKFSLGVMFGVFLSFAFAYFFFFAEVPVGDLASNELVAALLGAFAAGAIIMLMHVFSVFGKKLDADANLILSSFAEYERLFDQLTLLRDVWDAHSTNLEKINTDNFDKSMVALTRRIKIEKDEWKQIRKVKTFFKSKYAIVGEGFFSDRAIAKSIERGGLKMLFKELKKMDLHRFYSETKPEKLSPKGFENEVHWYRELERLVDRHKLEF